METFSQIKQKKKWVRILAVLLALFQCLYGCLLLIYVFNPFGLSEKVFAMIVVPVMAAGEIVTQTANNAYVHLKYDEEWIKDHTKQEIVEKYGEFDVYRDNMGYYKTREISDARFYAVIITFDKYDSVENVNMNGYGAHAGG